IFSSGIQELNLVLKADVAGSIEAIQDEIAKLPQSEVAVRVIHSAVGGINESDVMLAAASKAVVLGFNVRPVGDARAVSDREGIEIRSYSVIYRGLEDLRAAMGGMLVPDEVESAVGSAEVRQIFKASKIGTIAGSYVTSGKLERGATARLVRDGLVVYEGRIESLRRFNEDAKEVLENFECGIVLKDYADVKEGDMVEAYETKQVERELS
ncbi:MAG: translation initiation factor IF-2, partial [Actinomycetes bacterium]